MILRQLILFGSLYLFIYIINSLVSQNPSVAIFGSVFCALLLCFAPNR